MNLNKLIFIELKKVFHKKSIYVIYGLMVIFCLLNNILYWMDYDEDGNYKYIDQTNLNNEVQSLKEELKNYDVENDDDISMYLSIQTKLDLIHLQKKFSSHSWQYRKVSVYLYELVYQLNYARYVEKDPDKIDVLVQEYNDAIKKLEEDRWDYFLELEKEKLEQERDVLKSQLKLVVDKKQQLELEQELLEQEKKLKVVNYRLENKIKEDSSYLNLALEGYQESEKTIEYYSLFNRARTRLEELEYRNALASSKMNQYILNNKQNVNKQNNLNYQLRTIVEDYEIFIIILLLIVSSTIICDEFRDGTIKLLLIKPYSRCKILLSKYFASVIVMGISILFLILVQFMIGSAIFGFDSLKIPVVVYHFRLSKITTYSVFIYMMIRILAKLPLLLMLLSLSFLLGILFCSNVVAISIPLMIYMFSSSIHSLAVQYHLKFMRYFVSMNWNFQDYLFGGISDFEFIYFRFSCVIWLLYFIIIGVLAWISFNKKNIRNI